MVVDERKTESEAEREHREDTHMADNSEITNQSIPLKKKK